MHGGRWIVAAMVCLTTATSLLRAESAAQSVAKSVTVAVDADSSPRAKYGAQRLREAIRSDLPAGAVGRIVIAKPNHQPDSRAEGFTLKSADDGTITIGGSDESGVLYGCIELARQIHESKALPKKLDLTDAPVMKLRGPCIGMQKMYVLPGRRVYEYPYTSDLFPFFYDKAFWQEYLDFLADNRMNTLYLWSGHPFASLVKLKDYPYALEVDEAQYQKNVEMYRWIAAECDKRGIWLVQMFYNILLSKPFAEKNGLETQLAAPVPVAADYTRKSIAEFVKQYPHVGLMVCLGEALQGIDNQKQWLTEVILPGIHHGMKQANLVDEPPVVIRTHATDLSKYMADALAIYKNIYTEAKFNGESLTTWEPRGRRQEVHQAMSKLGSTHLINVHILANLEPFRYGATSFIQKCVQAGRDRLGARGVHLYPLAYWNWPDAPDKADPPLKQWRRDWIWFEAWARYSWNPDIDQATDHAYWVGRLAEMYGTSGAAENILAAYNDSGECAPRLLRRFGITEGNRQTLSLGMTLSELTDPDKFRAFPELWESQSPPGERLQEYVEKEWDKQPHEGETPPSIIAEVLNFSQKAVAEIEAAEPGVSKNKEEFERLRNDMLCIREMSQFYAAKVNASMLVLRYGFSHDLADMDKAQQRLAESVEYFRTLTRLTSGHYLFANTMQTSQRKIPVPGGANGKPANYLWSQLLPIYEKELTDFQKKVSDLKHGAVAATDESTIKPLAALRFKLLAGAAETYDVKVSAKVFTDRDATIQSLAPELVGLTGIRFSDEALRAGKSPAIQIESDEPVQILIGYFKSDDKGWRKPPDLETDALAGEHGGTEPVIQNAVSIAGLPPMDVHVMTYDKGRQKIDVRGSGSFIILGVVPQQTKIEKRDAHRAGGK